MISEYEHDCAVRIMLSKWRIEAGYTQQQIGDFLGISRRYVQMIESGECRVKSYTILQWADLTGHDPILCMQQILHPEDSFSGSAIERKKKMIASSLDVCAEDELDAFIEIILQDHGGNRRALAHLIAAYTQLEPGDKQNIALLIINCFQILMRKKKLRFLPNLDLVSAYREKAVEAFIKGLDRYDF